MSFNWLGEHKKLILVGLTISWATAACISFSVLFFSMAAGSSPGHALANCFGAFFLSFAIAGFMAAFVAGMEATL